MDVFDRIYQAVKTHKLCHVCYATLDKLVLPGESRREAAQRIGRLNKWEVVFRPQREVVVFKTCG